MSPGLFRFPPSEKVPLIQMEEGTAECGWGHSFPRRSPLQLKLGIGGGVAIIFMLVILVLTRPHPAIQVPSSLTGAPLYSYHHGVNFGGWLVMEAWLFPNVPLAHAGRLGLRENQELDYINRMRHLGIDAIKSMHTLWNGYIVPDLMTATDVGPYLRALKTDGVSHIRIPVGWWIMEAPTEIPDQYQGRENPTNRDWGYTKDGFVSGGIVYLEQILRLLKQLGIRAIIDMHALPGGQVKHMGYTGKWFESADFFNGCDRWYADGNPYSQPPTSKQGGNDFLVQGMDALTKMAAWIASMEDDPSTSGTIIGLSLWNEALFADDAKARALLVPCALKVVTQMRRILPSHRYAIILNWFNHALNWAEWMATHRKQLGDGVIADVHIYHTFDLPAWAAGCPKCSTTLEAKGGLICKSCFDDAWQLGGWSKHQIPFIVGEWSVANCDMYGTHPGIIHDPDFLYAWYASQKSVFRNFGADGDYFWTGLVQTGAYDPTVYNDEGKGSKTHVATMMQELAKDKAWQMNNKWKFNSLLPTPETYLMDWSFIKLRSTNTSKGHPIALTLGCDSPTSLCVVPSVEDMCQFTPTPKFRYRGRPGCKVDLNTC